MVLKETVLLLVLCCFSAVGGLECYSCQRVTDVSHCNYTVTCGNDESCFLSSDQNTQIPTFTLGCLHNQQCGTATSSAGGVLVGRRQTNYCHECCSKDFCNNALCSHLKPSACVDDEQVDCANMHSLFNICNDIPHAKLICPKFCHLCGVDITCQDLDYI